MNKKIWLIGGMLTVILASIILFNYDRSGAVFRDSTESNVHGYNLNKLSVFEDYVIEENIISIDTPKINAKAPFNISSGFAEFELTSKIYSGEIQMVWLVNTEEFDFAEPQLYNPTIVNYTHEKSCDNFEYTLTPKYFICYADNGSIEYEHSFEWADLESKTAYWNVSYTQEWSDFHKFDVAHFEEGSLVRNFTGMNKGYIVNTSINANQTYRLRTQVIIPRKGGFTLEKVTSKYWWAIKPSSWTWRDTFDNDYYIDPWVDSAGTDQGLDSIDEGLVAYWKLDGNLVDNYRGLYNGTAATGSPTHVPDGFLNGSYYFDGDDIVNLSDIDDMEGSDNLTMNIWLNDTFTTNYEVVLRKDQGNNDIQFGWYGRNSPAANSLTIQLNNGAVRALDPAVTLWGGAADWKMITFTYDGETLRYYVNAIVNSSLSTSGDMSSEQTGICFGGRCIPSGGFQYYVIGSMDELGFWNRTLNSSEIEGLYNGGAGATFEPISDVTISLNITDPLESNIVTKNVSDNMTTTFNFTDGAVPITSGVSIINVTIDGNHSTILTNSESANTTLFYDPGNWTTGSNCPADRNWEHCDTGDGFVRAGDSLGVATTNGSYVGMWDHDAVTEVLLNSEDFSSCDEGWVFISVIGEGGLDGGENLTLFIDNSTSKIMIYDSEASSENDDTWRNKVFKIVDSVNLSDNITLSVQAKMNGGAQQNEVVAFDDASLVCELSDSKTDQLWYESPLWKVNHTVPADLTNGLKNLTVNISYSSEQYVDTEPLSVNISSVGGAIDSCSYTSGNWDVDCSDDCVISGDVTVDGSDIFLLGTGTFTINSGVKVKGWNYLRSDNDCYIKTLGSGGFY